MKKLFEKAPPGKKYEKLVLNLKKKYGETSERPFAIAWSIYNKNKKEKNEAATVSSLGLTGTQDQLLAEKNKTKRNDINSFFSKLNESMNMEFEDFLENFGEELIHQFGGDNVEDITNYKEEENTIAEVVITLPEITDESFWIGIYASGEILARPMSDGWETGVVFNGLYEDYDSIPDLVADLQHLLKRHIAETKKFKKVYESLMLKRLSLI